MERIEEMLKKRMAKAGLLTPETAGPGWAALSNHLDSVAEQRTGRLDVNVSVMPGGTVELADKDKLAPNGGYDFDRAKIFLNGDVLPVAPDEIDMADPEHFGAMAGLYGEFIKQTGHAEHSEGMRPALVDGKMHSLTSALEDIRVEKKLLDRKEPDKDWLRTAASADVLRRISEVSSKKDAAALATQTLGRVAAGSMEASDVDELRDVFEEILGEDTLNKLQELWDRALDVDDGNPDELLGLARGVGSLLVEDEDGSEAMTDGESSSGSEGEGTGEGEGDEELSGEDRETLKEALKEAMESAGEDASENLAESGSEEAEDMEEAVGSSTDNIEEPEGSDEEEDAPEGGGRGLSGFTSVRAGERDPTDDERIQRNKLATILKKVRWRDRKVAKRNTELPPGRLRSREAVRASAEVSQGRLSTAKPWQHKKRTHVDEPTIKCGVIVDVSGSMSSNLEGVSSSMWIISEGVRECGGISAGVAFSDVASLVVPKEKQQKKKVKQFAVGGGTDHIHAACKLVEDELELIAHDGPALVVVVSDGDWYDQGGKAGAYLKKLHESGGKSIMVNIGGGGRSQPEFDRTCNVSSSKEVAHVVGNACADALRGVPVPTEAPAA